MPPAQTRKRGREIRARSGPGYTSFTSPLIFGEAMFPKNTVIVPEKIMVFWRELGRLYGATLPQSPPGVYSHRERYSAREGVIRGPMIHDLPENFQSRSG